MLPYCLKCREKIDSKNLNVVKTNNEYWSHQTGRLAIVKNQDLSKSKKLMDY